MGRNLLTLAVGLVAGIFVIYIIEAIGHIIYPLPDGYDPSNTEAVKAYIRIAPVGALWIVILSYAAGTFSAGLVCSLLAKSRGNILALVAGAIFTVFGLITLITIPHPVWFWVVSLMVFIPFSMLGARLGSRFGSK